MTSGCSRSVGCAGSAAPGGKGDALDAIRAARSVLGQERPATPRAGGERQALQALVAAREGAVNAKCAGLGQLRNLLVTTPEPLRNELRTLTPARLLRQLAAARPERRRDPRAARDMLALRSIAQRVLQLTALKSARAPHARSRRSRASSPPQPARPARRVGPHSAAQLVLSWSHPGRIRSEAAFARLAGAAPIPASSGQTIRYRLDPSGDRQTPTAPSTLILVTRKRTHPANQGLHRTPDQRRQDPPRSDPLPQALPRPQSLPPTRTRTANERLTNIEASLAQASEPASASCLVAGCSTSEWRSPRLRKRSPRRQSQPGHLQPDRPFLSPATSPIEHFVESHSRDDDQQPEPPVVPQPLTESVYHGCQHKTVQILARYRSGCMVGSSWVTVDHWF